MKLEKLNNKYISNNELSPKETVKSLLKDKKSGKRLSQALAAIHNSLESWISTPKEQRMLKIIEIAKEKFSQATSIKNKYRENIKSTLKKIKKGLKRKNNQSASSTTANNQNTPVRNQPQRQIQANQTPFSHRSLEDILAGVRQTPSTNLFTPVSQRQERPTQATPVPSSHRNPGNTLFIPQNPLPTSEPSFAEECVRIRPIETSNQATLEQAINADNLLEARRCVEALLTNSTIFGRTTNTNLLVKAIDSYNYAIAKEILRLPLTPYLLSGKDISGNAPLHKVCFTGSDQELIIELVRKGACLTQRNDQGKLPLEMYLESAGGAVLDVMRQIHPEITDNSNEIRNALSVPQREERIQILRRLAQSARMTPQLIRHLAIECNMHELFSLLLSTPQTNSAPQTNVAQRTSAAPQSSSISPILSLDSRQEALLNRNFAVLLEPGVTYEMPSRTRTNEVIQLEILAQEHSVPLSHGTRTFLSRIYNEDSFVGTPQAGSGALRVFWNTIRTALCHILDHIQQIEDTSEKKRLIEYMDAELNDASSHCGGRYYQEALRLYRKICLGQGESFEMEANLTLAELRANILETITLGYAQNDQIFDAHKLNFVIKNLGRELSIPGYQEITRFHDTFASGAGIPLDEVRRKFREQYVPYTVVNYIFQTLKDDGEFRSKYSTWWKENTPSSYRPERIQRAQELLRDRNISESDLKDNLEECDIYCNAPLNTREGRDKWMEAVEDDRRTTFVNEEVFTEDYQIRIEKIVEMLEKMGILRPINR